MRIFINVGKKYDYILNSSGEVKEEFIDSIIGLRDEILKYFSKSGLDEIVIRLDNDSIVRVLGIETHLITPCRQFLHFTTRRKWDSFLGWYYQTNSETL